MAAKCPMCDGPVTITGHESNVKEGYTIKLPTYTSTAAEQLVEQEKETELYVARTTFLEKQLADKERELEFSRGISFEADKQCRELQTKLTAANAVVVPAEAWADWIESNEWTPINTVQGNLLRAVEKWRKLQGGS